MKYIIALVHMYYCPYISTAQGTALFHYYALSFFDACINPLHIHTTVPELFLSEEKLEDLT